MDGEDIMHPSRSEFWGLDENRQIEMMANGQIKTAAMIP
jgi:hypothetical protein